MAIIAKRMACDSIKMGWFLLPVVTPYNLMLHDHSKAAGALAPFSGSQIDNVVTIWSSAIAVAEGKTV